MDAIVDFVVDNYIWFLIGGFVLIIALIGFVFDNKFKNKNNGDKKEKDTSKLEQATVQTSEKNKEDNTDKISDVQDNVADPSLINQVEENVQSLSFDMPDTDIFSSENDVKEINLNDNKNNELEAVTLADDSDIKDRDAELPLDSANSDSIVNDDSVNNIDSSLNESIEIPNVEEGSSDVQDSVEDSALINKVEENVQPLSFDIPVTDNFSSENDVKEINSDNNKNNELESVAFTDDSINNINSSLSESIETPNIDEDSSSDIQNSNEEASIIDEFDIEPLPETAISKENIDVPKDEISLPNIESLNKNDDLFDDEDDVWKF